MFKNTTNKTFFKFTICFCIIVAFFSISPSNALSYMRWNFTSSVEGWTGRNTTVRYSPDGNGRLYMDTYGSDPGMVSPSLSLSASSNNLLKMYAWTYCSDKNATIYFMRYGSSTVYTGGTVYLNSGSSGGIYEVDMSSNSNWTGTITQIRIDPAGSCGTVSDPGFVAFDWIEVNTVPQPDLVVLNQNANPTTIEAGSTTDISCSVRNQGSGAAGSSYVGYYLSNNTTYDTSDIYLGYDYVSSLSSGSSSAESAPVTIPPDTTAGTKYILFYADKDGSLSESNESNNVVYNQITVVSKPDLIVINQNANPTTIEAGSTTDISCSVRNQGSGTAGSSYVGYYLSNNTTYDTSDIYLGHDYVSSLSSGSSSAESAPVTIPSGTSSGTKYLLFYADEDGVVSESNESNNDDAYVQISVSDPSVSLNKTSLLKGEVIRASWSGFDGSVNVQVYRGGAWWADAAINVPGSGYQDLDTGVLVNGEPWESRNDYKVKIEFRVDPSIYIFSNLFSVIDSPPYFSPLPTLDSSVKLSSPPIYLSGTGRDDISLKNIRMVVSGPRGNNIEAFTPVSLSGTSVDVSNYYFDPGNTTYAGLPGPYTVELIITDISDQTASETFSVTVTQEPNGSLDAADCSSIRGWARDPDTTDPIEVRLFVDGDSGSGVLIGNYEANIFRSDLPYTDKNHGFNVPIPISLMDGGSHQIYVYAIDAGDGSLNNLPGSPKTVVCSLPSPTGFNAVPSGEGIRLSWNAVSEVSDPEYQIFWGLDNSVSEINHAGTFTTSSTIEDHTPLDAGDEYFYAIRTCSEGVCGSLNDVQSAQVANADLTISMQALTADNVQMGGSYPITCTVNRTGGLLRPTTGYVRVYVYMNQSPDPATVIPAEHFVLEDDGTPFDVTVNSLDDGTETITNFNIPIPVTIEGPHYIHVKVDGPEYWNESNEANNWATASETIAVWRDEVPTTASDYGILARTWDDSNVYWVNKHSKKWLLVGIEDDPGYVVTQLGYTDTDIHWYLSGSLGGLEDATEIVNANDSNFVYRRQGSEPEDSTVYIVRNGVSDWFFNWDTFINSEFGTEDVYWATDAGFDWIQSFYPPGQMIGLQPRIRISPKKLIFN